MNVDDPTEPKPTRKRAYIAPKQHNMAGKLTLKKTPNSNLSIRTLTLSWKNTWSVSSPRLKIPANLSHGNHELTTFFNFPALILYSFSIEGFRLFRCRWSRSMIELNGRFEPNYRHSVSGLLMESYSEVPS